MKKHSLVCGEMEHGANGYVIVPRFIIEWMYDTKDNHIRMLGILLHYLWSKCFFADKGIMVHGETIHCARGEYIGTQQKIADKLGFKKTTMVRLLQELQNKGYIEIKNIVVSGQIRASRIRVLDYDKYNGKVSVAKPKPYVATATKNQTSKPVEENGEAERLRRIRSMLM